MSAAILAIALSALFLNAAANAPVPVLLEVFADE